MTLFTLVSRQEMSGPINDDRTSSLSDKAKQVTEQVNEQALGTTKDEADGFWGFEDETDSRYFSYDSTDQSQMSANSAAPSGSVFN